MVRVWDLSTRAFHWLLVALFGACWWSAENQHMDWHLWCGYAIAGLLAFRLYWGFVGASTARFANFVAGPLVIWAYLRGRWEKQIGHNPLGALSVVALLVLLIAQVLLGAFAVDEDGLESGPLAVYVNFDQGRLAAHWHHLIFNLLLALIVLHVGAIAFYTFVKRENLVSPMFTGRTKGHVLGARLAPVWRIAPGLIIALALVIGIKTAFKF